jgi:hypothetical protein
VHKLAFRTVQTSAVLMRLVSQSKRAVKAASQV